MRASRVVERFPRSDTACVASVRRSGARTSLSRCSVERTTRTSWTLISPSGTPRRGPEMSAAQMASAGSVVWSRRASPSVVVAEACGLFADAAASWPARHANRRPPRMSGRRVRPKGCGQSAPAGLVFQPVHVRSKPKRRRGASQRGKICNLYIQHGRLE